MSNNCLGVIGEYLTREKYKGYYLPISYKVTLCPSQNSPATQTISNVIATPFCGFTAKVTTYKCASASCSTSFNVTMNITIIDTTNNSNITIYNKDWQVEFNPNQSTTTPIYDKVYMENGHVYLVKLTISNAGLTNFCVGAGCILCADVEISFILCPPNLRRISECQSIGGICLSYYGTEHCACVVPFQSTQPCPQGSYCTDHHDCVSNGWYCLQPCTPMANGYVFNASNFCCCSQTPLQLGTVKIAKYMFPSNVFAGHKIDAVLLVQVANNPVYNPAGGIIYVSGPSQYVNIYTMPLTPGATMGYQSFQVQLGNAAIAYGKSYTGPAGPGFSFYAMGFYTPQTPPGAGFLGTIFYIELPQPGTYTFKVFAGTIPRELAEQGTYISTAVPGYAPIASGGSGNVGSFNLLITDEVSQINITDSVDITITAYEYSYPTGWPEGMGCPVSNTLYAQILPTYVSQCQQIGGQVYVGPGYPSGVGCCYVPETTTGP